MIDTSSPYLNFAENLRRLSTAKSSIAQVCRDLNMNRQQFNKYLSGANLPGQAILERISQYFGVGQGSLFDSPENIHNGFSEDATSPGTFFSRINATQFSIMEECISGSDNVNMQEGCYVIYFPGPNNPVDIVRSIMVVFKVGSLMCFRRYTRLRKKGEPNYRFAFGKHDGIIIERNGRTFLLGKNSEGFGELSLISFGSSATPHFGMMAGLAMVFTQRGEPMALRTTLSYFGAKKNLRRALRLCGIVPGDSQEIPVGVRKSILDEVDFPFATILPFALFDDLRS
jgi:transcriptional regulator with XRE-family HTH domain